MKPLVLTSSVAAVAFWGTLIAWTAGEFYMWRLRGAGAQAGADRTGILAAATGSGGILGGVWAASNVTGAGIAGGRTWPVVAGLAVIYAGLALRSWSIATLGRYFTYAVQVERGQRVIQHGPYSVVRHPGYAGFLLAHSGTGLALDNWLSLAIATLLPLVGILVRVRVEEDALVRELGDTYRSYCLRTRRLVPGIW